ncbi:two-component sensor histidine kinase [Virgisporangium aliadipatigenens]|uniref:histidine kinase n=1 Tax=Virgisporangium aliadipatigenens TaxID=741659 RepID=A0A8J3YFS1_9ACTN|nr:sensor histidine kinase [Virgisporangium aliadipatigenens]GIJ44399.1 two-component sensor histidine kinase [Virgisporangium aliadipatigenens]
MKELLRELNPTAGEPVPPWGRFEGRVRRLPHVAVLAFAVLVWGVTAGSLPEGSGAAAAVGLAQAVPLMVALVRPVGGFWLSVVAGPFVSELLRQGAATPVWAEASVLVHLVVLAVVGLRVRPLTSVVLWLVTLLAGAVLVQRMPGVNASEELPIMTVFSAVVLVAAAAVRGRGRTTARIAALERANEEERVRRSILEERTRIARELHDIVAHHMSLIAIHAETAPYRIPDLSPEAADTLVTIRKGAVEALTDLRRLLGVLRGDGAADGAAVPTLDQFDRMIDAVRAAGTEVTTATHGERRDLPPEVGAAAYRIVQESLSNARRHAPGAPVRVALEYGPRTLGIRVENDPPGRVPEAGKGSGHGVRGMRERAAALGGTLTAGPREDGGFAVRADLPTGGNGTLAA